MARWGVVENGSNLTSERHEVIAWWTGVRGSSYQPGRHSEQGGALGREQGEPGLDWTHTVASLGLWTGRRSRPCTAMQGHGVVFSRRKRLILDWVAGPVLAGTDREVLDANGWAQTGCLRFWQNGSMFLGGWRLERVS